MGFRALGSDVAVDSSVAFYGCKHISIGSRVRIDCFCVISAGPGQVVIGDNVHIAAATHIGGTGGVVIEDFAGVSSRVSIFSSSGDYAEGHLSNPTVPARYRKDDVRSVILRKHALIGSGAVIMPGVTIGTGASVGALSLVNKSIPELAIVSGQPVRKIGERNGRRLEELERAYRAEVARHEDG